MIEFFASFKYLLTRMQKVNSIPVKLLGFKISFVVLYSIFNYICFKNYFLP